VAYGPVTPKSRMLSRAPAAIFASACKVISVSLSPKSVLLSVGGDSWGGEVDLLERVTAVWNTAEPCMPVLKVPDAPPESTAVRSTVGTNTSGPMTMGGKLTVVRSTAFS
jgi:hypothetical protein